MSRGRDRGNGSVLVPVAIASLGLVTLISLAVVVAPDELEDVLGQESKESHRAVPVEDPTFDLRRYGDRILVEYVEPAADGPRELPLSRLVLDREGRELAPCVGEGCSRGGRLGPGETARAPCEPSGSIETLVIVGGDVVGSERIRCP